MIAFTFATSTCSLLLLVYNIFIAVYGAALRLAASWSPKAKQWVEGRKDVFGGLRQQIAPGKKLIWMHCASAGEFEQGKPLIEAIKETYPHHQVLVSFFSPSGYQAGKKYKPADIICFLPEDTAANANEFLDLTQPSLAIFVKYDYWYHHLRQTAKMKVPLLLVSSIFREQQPFFKWYGGLHRKMLNFFSRIFVQNERSKDLLAGIGITHVSVAGDTRYDRVMNIAANAKEIPMLEVFAKGDPVLVAGSTWPDDEKLLTGENSEHCKLVIAPHEIRENKIADLVQMFPGALRYSQADPATIGNTRVLIIDNYGMLSSLYRYASVSYIGGGFNKSGIHNTLEAAVWGSPVVFGPEYKKFREARELVEKGAAFSISNRQELANVLSSLFSDQGKTENAGRQAADHVKENTGAVQKIISFIQENRLLTT